MYLPSPTYDFTIPSVHDGIQLDCRIYLPHEPLQVGSASEWHIQGAIVAHPYAPLGGCYDDPVVGFIGGELLTSGWVVGTFNFRGAGDSEGRTSWTAKPELADYVSFYGFMLYYLRSLRQQQAGDGGKANIHIILGGYSYGSLVASHLPTIDVVANLFKESARDSPAYKIRETAEEVSAWSKASSSTSANAVSSDDMNGDQDMSKTTISYLLMSPLLPPINLFLTIFSKLSFDAGVQTLAQRKRISCPKPADQLCSHSTLAIYGTQDGFTSAGKLHKWSDELSHAPRSKFQSAEIDGAGHFWRENGVASQAREALRNWLAQIS